MTESALDDQLCYDKSKATHPNFSQTARALEYVFRMWTKNRESPTTQTLTELIISGDERGKAAGELLSVHVISGNIWL